MALAPDAATGRVWPAGAGLVVLAAILAAAFASGTPNNARWLLLGLVAAAWLVFAAVARRTVLGGL